MNSDCIILELLNRVGKLEEEVANLKKGPAREVNQNITPRVADYGIKKKSKTDEVAEYITRLKENAKDEGRLYLDLVCLDIHRAFDFKNRHPLVCSAMRKVMGEKDRVLRDTKSHSSSTYTVRYYL